MSVVYACPWLPTPLQTSIYLASTPTSNDRHFLHLLQATRLPPGVPHLCSSLVNGSPLLLPVAHRLSFPTFDPSSPIIPISSINQLKCSHLTTEKGKQTSSGLDSYKMPSLPQLLDDSDHSRKHPRELPPSSSLESAPAFVFHQGH